MPEKTFQQISEDYEATWSYEDRKAWDKIKAKLNSKEMLKAFKAIPVAPGRGDAFFEFLTKKGKA